MSWQQSGWLTTLALGVLLWAPVLAEMTSSWRGDASLSHGPLVPVIAAGLLWARRDELRRLNAADGAGLALVIFAALLHVAAVWADIEFLKPLSLIALTAGALWYLGGWQALNASIGALGFLVFMIPWPTVLVERLAFPLQLASSSYAAMFGGLFGLPIEREGVQLAVQAGPDVKPIYSILVAQKCSGLTSLTVLLALGYLVAHLTPVKPGWRALLVAVVVPLTLLCNSLRLTFILLAGAHGSPALAQWIHDHEGPVLIFCCSLGLMGLRQALLAWLQPRGDREGEAVVQAPHSGP